METLRVINSTDSNAYHQIFQYLEDNAIQKDKAGIWYCMFCMAKKIFTIYLSVMGAKAKTLDRDKDLENMVMFLLVKFNHINKKIRPLADHLLAKLMETFPYLLWSEKTLRCIMDITELLASSLTMDPNQVAPEFEVGVLKTINFTWNRFFFENSLLSETVKNISIFGFVKNTEKIS